MNQDTLGYDPNYDLSGLLNEVKPGKQLGASSVNWSVGLVCLRMLGIPRARAVRLIHQWGGK